MRRTFVIVLCFMLAFSLTFTEVFNFIASTGEALSSSLSLVSTILPGFNFTSDSPLPSYGFTEEGYYKFNGLNINLNLPEGTNWYASFFEEQSIQSWFDNYVLPYQISEFIDASNIKYSISTFGLKYPRKIEGGWTWADPLVNDVSLSPTVYRAKYRINDPPDDHFTYLFYPSSNITEYIYLVKLSIEYSTPDSFRLDYSTGLIPSFTNIILYPYYKRQFLDGKESYTLDIYVPITASIGFRYDDLRIENDVVVGDQFSGRILFVNKSFGYDINLLTTSSYTDSQDHGMFVAEANLIDLISLTDTGETLYNFLSTYDPQL